MGGKKEVEVAEFWTVMFSSCVSVARYYDSCMMLHVAHHVSYSRNIYDFSFLCPHLTAGAMLRYRRPGAKSHCVEAAKCRVYWLQRWVGL